MFLCRAKIGIFIRKNFNLVEKAAKEYIFGPRNANTTLLKNKKYLKSHQSDMAH